MKTKANSIFQAFGVSSSTRHPEPCAKRIKACPDQRGCEVPSPSNSCVIHKDIDQELIDLVSLRFQCHLMNTIFADDYFKIRGPICHLLLEALCNVCMYLQIDCVQEISS
jgi:hypothetical protein